MKVGDSKKCLTFVGKFDKNRKIVPKMLDFCLTFIKKFFQSPQNDWLFLYTWNEWTKMPDFCPTFYRNSIWVGKNARHLPESCWKCSQNHLKKSDFYPTFILPAPMQSNFKLSMIIKDIVDYQMIIFKISNRGTFLHQIFSPIDLERRLRNTRITQLKW